MNSLVNSSWCMRYFLAGTLWLFGTAASLSEKSATVDFPALFNGREGCFVLYEAATDNYVRYNPKGCGERFSPCSTFKIVNSLIALQTDVASGPDFALKWDGITHPIASWN